ncbi:MAG: glycosyltransferase [Halobacteriota archaeon]
MTKILFIAEALSWSQVVRLMVLARSLDPRRYEIHFACARFDEHLFHGTNFKRWPISLLPTEKIDAANEASIARPYNKAILKRYVADELRLYEAIHPDVVVSDFRWSTAISGPLFGVPCATLINAYWAHWRSIARGEFPLLNHRMIRFVDRLHGAPILDKISPIVIPKALRYPAAPVNKLRQEHGLPELGDLIDVLLWGDRVLFPDDPLITPLTDQAPHETFLGPVLWSPEIPVPEYWDELGHDRPMVYVTMGSSGTVKVGPLVLAALSSMDVDVIFSTAGRYTPKHVPDNVHVVDMVPGDLAARKATVVVCNGGASTGYQALAEGTPVVGIPSILDQLLAATAMRDAGTGVLLHAAPLTPAKVCAAVERVMGEEDFTQTAQRVAASFARFDPHTRFRAVVDEVVAHGG